jgi:hypothetical protein
LHLIAVRPIFTLMFFVVEIAHPVSLTSSLIPG